MNVLLKTFLLTGFLGELSVEAGGYPSYPVAPQQPQASFGVNLGTALKEGGEAVAALSSLFGGASQPQASVPPVARAPLFPPASPTYGTGNYGSGYPQQGQYPSYPSSATMPGYPSASAGYGSYAPSYSRPTASLGYTAPQSRGYDDSYRVPPVQPRGYDDPYGRAPLSEYDPSDQSGRQAGFDPNRLPYDQGTGVDPATDSEGMNGYPEDRPPNPYAADPVDEE